ncbi:hypothetical protein J437_LFUL007193 [Ladona fulva]|uniref:Large ribosomal subunit protein bL35m n=1 Tax=Ladona fulva TaxID=123851 RepID=A0A8K0P084_LADFU|nr:hypothetical protein J437_LFUL007193 [Ladona fulva]
MFRLFSSITRGVRVLESAWTRSSLANQILLPPKSPSCQASAAFSQTNNKFTPFLLSSPSYSLPEKVIAPILSPSVRNVTKFSLKKGKRKTVKAVIRRFFRLDWGIWIRTKAGRGKHLWRKTPQRKRRLRQHVFCNATQSTLLDKMVTRYWKTPRHYVDDPYEPYHRREEFAITRTKPR